MSDSRPHVILRHMTLADVDQVVALDHLSFPTPWPARTYRYEINDTSRSLMFALEPANITPLPRVPRSLAKWITGQRANVSTPLLGYSGCWKIADEAHISTIAVHPDWRGKKLGELLVWSMIRQAIRRGATKVTLEVRVSNTVAQNLYTKYDFKIVGTRRGYYRSDGEDAYTMLAAPLNGPYRNMMVEHGRELARCLRVTDRL